MENPEEKGAGGNKGGIAGVTTLERAGGDKMFEKFLEDSEMEGDEETF